MKIGALIIQKVQNNDKERSGHFTEHTPVVPRHIRIQSVNMLS